MVETGRVCRVCLLAHAPASQRMHAQSAQPCGARPSPFPNAPIQAHTLTHGMLDGGWPRGGRCPRRPCFRATRRQSPRPMPNKTKNVRSHTNPPHTGPLHPLSRRHLGPRHSRPGALARRESKRREKGGRAGLLFAHGATPRLSSLTFPPTHPPPAPPGHRPRRRRLSLCRCVARRPASGAGRAVVRAGEGGLCWDCWRVWANTTPATSMLFIHPPSLPFTTLSHTHTGQTRLPPAARRPGPRPRRGVGAAGERGGSAGQGTRPARGRRVGQRRARRCRVAGGPVRGHGVCIVGVPRDQCGRWVGWGG